MSDVNAEKLRELARLATPGPWEHRHDDSTCVYDARGVCGTARNPTWDHVIPLAKGGDHHPLNLQPLCRACNEKKQAQTADYRTDEQREAVSAVWVVEFRRAVAEERAA